MDRRSVTFSGLSVERTSRNDDISTRPGENAKRIASDQVVILAAQLHALGSMEKAHDAEYCTHGRGESQLEGSLTRSQTDHRDSWQIYGVVHESERDLIFAPKEAADVLLEAQRQSLLAGPNRLLVQPE